MTAKQCGEQLSPNDAALGLFPVLCKYATKQEQANFAPVEVAQAPDAVVLALRRLLGRRLGRQHPDGHEVAHVVLPAPRCDLRNLEERLARHLVPQLGA